MFCSQNFISWNEVNLANYAHACFAKAMAEIVNKAITTNLLLQLIMNELILLKETLLDGKIFFWFEMWWFSLFSKYFKSLILFINLDSQVDSCSTWFNKSISSGLNKEFNSLIWVSFFSRNSLTISSVPNPFLIFKRIWSLSQDFSRTAFNFI